MTGVSPAESGDLHGDRPVGRGGDLLGRRPFAALIARQIRVNRPTDGLVVAVVGEWGSGKTSVLRMVAEELGPDATREFAGTSDEVVVVEFNPWLFSGSEQLTALFFLTLAEQLSDRLSTDRSAEVAERLRGYGAALGTLRALPGVGGVLGVGADVSREVAERLDKSPVDLAGERRRLAEKLRDLKVHLVVLIDDVDRLQTKAEIRDLMRMVKLVGDLPGVTYLLSYDRRPVVASLTSHGISGEEYLEKIVQVEHRLPQISRDSLDEMLGSEINTAIEDCPERSVDPERWPEVFAKVVQPLITTPRHVRRYGNALRLALDLHREEVDLVDQLALTSIATFLPSFHGQLADLADILVGETTLMSALLGGQDQDAVKARLESAAENSGNPKVALAAYALLFPRTTRALRKTETGRLDERDAQRWRRVADPEAFWTYMNAAVPEEALRVAEVRAVLEATKDRDLLATELERRDADELARLLDRLRAHVGEVSAESVPGAARVTLEHASQRIRAAPERLDDPMRRIEYFVADLVGQLPEDSRHQFLVDWANDEPELTAKLNVYNLGRFKTDHGDPLIDVESQARIRGDLAALVCSRSPDDLLELEDVGRLLFLTGEHLAGERLPTLKTLLSEDRVFLRYLLVFTEPSLSGGPRPLAWRDLEDRLGGDWLAARVNEVSPNVDLAEETAGVLETARHHAAAERSTLSEPPPAVEGSQRNPTRNRPGPIPDD